MKVYIVGSNEACNYTHMYRKAGFEVVGGFYDCDLVQFTGGEDVHASLYGEENHPSSMTNMIRDQEEIHIYNTALQYDIPMVGICRGGQFLNVMNGGRMYQDVDGHAIFGTHAAFDVESGRTVYVTSTHHQMMRPADNAIILCTAELSNMKSVMEDGVPLNIKASKTEPDVEAVFYDDTQCLCFQPHPEFDEKRVGDTRTYFFDLLETYILAG